MPLPLPRPHKMERLPGLGRRTEEGEEKEENVEEEDYFCVACGH